MGARHFFADGPMTSTDKTADQRMGACRTCAAAVSRQSPLNRGIRLSVEHPMMACHAQNSDAHPLKIDCGASRPNFWCAVLFLGSWVIKQDNVDATDAKAITSAIQAWNERKHKVMQPTHIEQAWQRLISQNWL